MRFRVFSYNDLYKRLIALFLIKQILDFFVSPQPKLPNFGIWAKNFKPHMLYLFGILGTRGVLWYGFYDHQNHQNHQKNHQSPQRTSGGSGGPPTSWDLLDLPDHPDGDKNF